MKTPSTPTVYELFHSEIQFQIPPYQRAYVWNLDQNWSVLWDDIETATSRFLDGSANGGPQKHFLGPIVLQQLPVDPGAVDQRLVIDGQQRLTTLQMFVSAAASVADEVGSNDAGEEFLGLTRNKGWNAEGDLVFKVWPCQRDRSSFIDALDGEASPTDKSGLFGAWNYFRGVIKEWLESEDLPSHKSVEDRLRALFTCIHSLLYVVSINLDETDNQQVIFETLNARGTGLGALDLVKNAVLLQAEQDSGNAQFMYDKYWAPTFEIEGEDYWGEEVRQGREKRARSDWFLMHWLALEIGEVVRADRLFDAMRRDVLHAPGHEPIEQLVPNLCRDAQIIRSFDDFEPGTPEELFFSRMEALDTTTMIPIALFLFRTEELSDERRMKALAALESWLVRRAILKMDTKGYNRTLTSLLSALKKDAEHADEVMLAELRSSDADTAIWPSDESLRPVLLTQPLYNRLTQKRVRMLLEACELDTRDLKTEAMPIPAGLTIEHAMPQSWEENWPLESEAEPEVAAEERRARIDRLGNLTLITQRLNSSLSNSPWLPAMEGESSKRKELSIRSVLLINSELCENDSWNEPLIDQRGERLATSILETWPGPSSERWALLDER